MDIPSGVVHTFEEVAGRARRIVALLHHLGLQHGDRVAVLAEGSPRYAELYQAVPMGGFVLVTLNSRYTLGGTGGGLQRLRAPGSFYRSRGGKCCVSGALSPSDGT